MPVEWQFCPRCETQLQGEPPLCPACGYDPAEPVAPPDPEAAIPYSERYRSLTFAGATETHRPRVQPIGRTRLLVAAALLAVLGLYGSMAMVSDARNRGADPGSPPTRVVTRP